MSENSFQKCELQSFTMFFNFQVSNRNPYSEQYNEKPAHWLEYPIDVSCDDSFETEAEIAAIYMLINKVTCRALWLHYAHNLLSILPLSIFYHKKMKSSASSSFSLVMQMNSFSLIKIIVIIENNSYEKIATAYLSSCLYLSVL